MDLVLDLISYKLEGKKKTFAYYSWVIISSLITAHLSMTGNLKLW